LFPPPIAAPIRGMHETYRMLGREHEADLVREAAKWQLADEARRAKRAAQVRQPSARSRFNPARAVILLSRTSRAI